MADRPDADYEKKTIQGRLVATDGKRIERRSGMTQGERVPPILRYKFTVIDDENKVTYTIKADGDWEHSSLWGWDDPGD